MGPKELMALEPIIRQSAYAAAIFFMLTTGILLVVVRTLWNTLKDERLKFDEQKDKWLETAPEIAKALASQSAAQSETNSFVRAIMMRFFPGVPRLEGDR